MGKPDTQARHGLAAGTKDEPAQPHGETPRRPPTVTAAAPPTPAKADAPADADAPPADAPEAAANSAPTETDWGLGEPKTGVSREAVLGAALVLVLLAAFGFVAYHKWQKHQADAKLIAQAEAQPDPPAPTEPAAADSSPLPPAQPPADPFDMPPQQEPPPAASATGTATVSGFFPAQSEPTSYGTASASVPSAASQSPAPPPQNFEPVAGTTSGTTFNPFPPQAANTSPPVQAEPPAPAASALPPAADDPFAGQATVNATPLPPASAPLPQTAALPGEPLPPQQPEPLPHAATGADGFFPPKPLDDVAMQGHPLDPAGGPPPSSPLDTDEATGGTWTPGAGQAASTTSIQPAPPATIPRSAAVSAAPGAGETAPANGSTPPVSPDQFMQPVEYADDPPAPANSPFPPQPGASGFDPTTGTADLPDTAGPPATASVPGTAGMTGTAPARDPFSPQPGAGPLAGSATTTAGRPTVYEVRPSDNYWTISRRHYGTARYFEGLARFNADRIPDPTRMRPGMKVLIPSRDALEARYPDLFGSTGPAAAADEPAGLFFTETGQPLYRVGPRDTLGEIAQKHLGRSSRWNEIFTLNRDRLAAPDTLKIGTVLKLPPDASRVQVTAGQRPIQ